MAINNDPRAFIETHFHEAWSYHYWHHLAYKYPKEVTYQNEIIAEQRIQSINRKLKKIGGNSFQRIAENGGGMTPLHVAGACKNLAAWTYFLSKGVSIDAAKDDFSNTQIDYIRYESSFWPSTFYHLKPILFVKQIFSDPKFGYWQHAATSIFEKDVYENYYPGVNSSSENIAGMTPLHIAAICCNKIAWKFFLKINPSVLLKDYFGNTPLDYAKDYQELLDATLNPLRPHIITTVLEESITHVFEKKRVPLAKGNFTYKKFTQDFGVEIKEILQSEMEPRTGANFGKLAQNLGITVKVLKGHSKARDCFFHQNERFISPYLKIDDSTLSIKDQNSPMSMLEKAIQSATSLFCYRSALSYLRDPKLRQIFGNVNSEQVLSDNPSLLKIKTNPASKFYFEGRNQITISSPKGLQALFEEQTLMTNYWLIGLACAIDRDGLDKIAKDLNKQFDQVQINLEEMHELGRLTNPNNRNSTGLIDLKKFESFDDILNIIAKEPHYIEPMKALRRDNKDRMRKMSRHAAKYTCQKIETLRLIAAQMGLKEDNIIRIPSVFYPLNNYLRPGPKGTLFILDFELCVNICEYLLQKAKHLSLSDVDIGHLKIYKNSAEKRYNETDSFLKTAEDNLKSKGFKTIPFPGYFSYDSKDENHCFNFMNFLSGWSSKTQKYFMINGGITVGDNLGRVFMDVFASFMHQYIEKEKLDIHFIGKSKKSSDFRENMEMWRSENLLGGIYDKTFESKTENHQHSD